MEIDSPIIDNAIIWKLMEKMMKWFINRIKKFISYKNFS